MAPSAWTTAWAQTRLAENPFRLGVASGEPTPDGVVLWTRLVSDPTAPTGGLSPEPVAVGWEIAEDEALTRIVGRGRTVAAPEAGHSVHIEAAGLRADRPYWYRFTAGGYESPVGRTRTAPAADADVQRLRIAYGSCQRYEVGFYSAHAALAQDEPDLVVFLGDYIYENYRGGVGGGVRRPPLEEAVDLDSYRLRYASYKADPDLQAAHACAPWLVMWDDHEVSNDYGNDQDRTSMDPASFLRRRAAAYQAYFENMPLRAATRPRGPDMRLYRALDWGRLSRLALLDDRQYRSPRACDAQSEGKFISIGCQERSDPARSILGPEQEAWLQARLRDTPATWNLLGQQSLMMEVVTPEQRVSNDGWSGYAQTRRRILEGWRDAKVANPVVLGGDVHAFYAADLALEPGGRPIASEFVGGSISSLGRSNELVQAMKSLHPDLKYAESETRGYGRLDITPTACRVTFRGVENALVQGSPTRDLAAFVVEAGQTGLQPT